MQPCSNDQKGTSVKREYLVSDAEKTWTAVVPLNAEDVEAVTEKNVPHQILQICKNTVERSVRLALADQRGQRYDEVRLEIDPETLTYDPKEL